MIIIFDLDYTLLDTKRFKAGLADVLGMNVKSFNFHYNKNFSSQGLNYNLNYCLKALKIENSITSVYQSRLAVNNFIKNINKYLAPGALAVINRLKKNKNKLILVSLGDRKWQKKKINSLKIKKYFNKIILTVKEKHKDIRFLKGKKDDILIINDNARESFRIKRALGRGKILLIRGPYSNNIKHKLNASNIKSCLEKL